MSEYLGFFIVLLLVVNNVIAIKNVAQAQKALAQMCYKLAAKNALIEQFHYLMANSSGVDGLHLNGDIADWDWLIENDWLSALQDTQS